MNNVTTVWTNEFWNILHLFSVYTTTDKTVFYDMLDLIATEYHPKAKQWMTTHKEELEQIDLFSWTYQLRKNISKCNTEKYYQTYYHVPSITKDVWGHYLWKWLHHMSYVMKSSLFQKVFDKCILIIPCTECKEHAIEYKNTNPFISNMQIWMIEFHNDVSRRINETTGTKKEIYKK